MTTELRLETKSIGPKKLDSVQPSVWRLCGHVKWLKCCQESVLVYCRVNLLTSDDLRRNSLSQHLKHNLQSQYGNLQLRPPTVNLILCLLQLQSVLSIRKHSKAACDECSHLPSWPSAFTPSLCHPHPQSSAANQASVMSHAEALIGCFFPQQGWMKLSRDVKDSKNEPQTSTWMLLITAVKSGWTIQGGEWLTGCDRQAERDQNNDPEPEPRFGFCVMTHEWTAYYDCVRLMLHWLILLCHSVTSDHREEEEEDFRPGGQQLLRT